MNTTTRPNPLLALPGNSFRKARLLTQVLWALVQSHPSIPLQRAVAALITEARIAQASKRSAKAFAALSGQRDLKVHLGCGQDMRPGWMNIDLLDPETERPTTGAVFIQYDLRLGLPLPNECARTIYSSHFFEHLEYEQTVKLLRDCYRSLQPDGVFRIALPNFKSLFRAYLEGDEAQLDLLIPRLPPRIRNAAPDAVTIIDHISHGVLEYGQHKHLYDEEKVVALLEVMGYRSVNASTFQSEIDVDNPLRRQYSFYVEAVK
jgi:predicted SAM-dependent methyltransferase